MITPFDWIVFAFLILLGLSGFTKGFLATLLGPLNLTLSLWIAWLFFQLTKNLPLTLLIGLFAPILLGLLTNILKSLFIRDTTLKLSWWTQISGAMLGVFWGGMCLVGCLWAYTFLPYVPQSAQQAIEISHSYQIFTQHFPARATSQSTNPKDKNLIRMPSMPVFQQLQQQSPLLNDNESQL